MKKNLVILFVWLLFPCNMSRAENLTWYAKISEKYTYDEMVQDIEQLEIEYSDTFLKTESIGQTFDGRSLYHVTVGPLEASRHILITGAIHGREYITTQLVMMQILGLCDFLMDSEKKYRGFSYKELLDNTAVHFVPMVNPDGVTISQLGLDGLNHRFTRQKIYQIYQFDRAIEIAPYLQQWKANARGVDLNRNFDAFWEEYKGTRHPSSNCYKGIAPLCESESKALADITEQFLFERIINYHTQGEVIYWYFGQIGELEDTSKQFAQSIAEVTGYPLNDNYSVLDPAGYKDWALQKKKIPSLTIEVGYGTNPVNAEQFPEIFKQNQDVVAETLYGLLVEKNKV